jgi:hypothetical protein
MVAPLNNAAFGKRIDHLTKNWSVLPVEQLEDCKPQAFAQRRAEFEYRQQRAFATRMQSTWQERERQLEQAAKERESHILNSTISDAAKRFASVKHQRLHSPELSETLQRGMWGITRHGMHNGEDDEEEEEAKNAAAASKPAADLEPSPSHASRPMTALASPPRAQRRASASTGSSGTKAQSLAGSPSLRSAPAAGGSGGNGTGGAHSSIKEAATAARRRRATTIEMSDYLAIRSLFKDIDDDGNGYLELHELMSFRRQFPNRLTADLFQRLLLKPDGCVFFDEFLMLFFPQVSKRQVELIVSAYERRLLESNGMSEGCKLEIAQDYERVAAESSVRVLRTLISWWNLGKTITTAVISVSSTASATPRQLPIEKATNSSSTAVSVVGGAAPNPAASSLQVANGWVPKPRGATGFVTPRQRADSAEGGAGGGGDGSDSKGTSVTHGPSRNGSPQRRVTEAVSPVKKPLAVAPSQRAGGSPSRQHPPPPATPLNHGLAPSTAAAAASTGADDDALIDIIGYLPVREDTRIAASESVSAIARIAAVDATSCEMYCRVMGRIADGMPKRQQAAAMDAVFSQLRDSRGDAEALSLETLRTTLIRALQRLSLTFLGFLSQLGGQKTMVRNVTELLELLEHRGLLRHIRVYPALALLPAAMERAVAASLQQKSNAPPSGNAAAAAPSGVVRQRLTEAILGGQHQRGARFAGSVVMHVRAGDVRALLKRLNLTALTPIALKDFLLKQPVQVGPWAYVPRGGPGGGGARPGAPRGWIDDRASSRGGTERGGGAASADDGTQSVTSSKQTGTFGRKAAAPTSTLQSRRASSSAASGGSKPLIGEAPGGGGGDDDDHSSNRTSVGGGNGGGGAKSSFGSTRPSSASLQRKPATSREPKDQQLPHSRSFESLAGSSVNTAAVAGVATTVGASADGGGGQAVGVSATATGGSGGDLRAQCIMYPDFVAALAVIEVSDFERLTAAYHMMLETGMLADRFDPSLHDKIEAMENQWDADDVIPPRVRAKLRGKDDSSSSRSATAATSATAAAASA